MDKELSYVLSLISKARHSSDRRLPTIRQMQAQSHLSRHRLQRAIAMLRMKGELEVKKGGGIFLPSPHPPKPARVTKRKSRREQIYARITREIRRGRYAAGAGMPLVKELAERYGTDRGTMRRVLDRLTEDKWLRYCRRRWYVTGSKSNTAVLNQILLVGTPLGIGIVQNIPWESRELIRLLDLECNRRGIRLRLCGLSDLVSLSDTGTLSMLKDSLGCVLWLFSSLEGLEWPELLRRAARFQKRVTVWDNMGVLPHPGQVVPLFPSLSFYAFARSEDDGYDVAMHVLQRGHTKAAFVTLDPPADWSELRYRAICRAFEQCGQGRGCRYIGCPDSSRINKFFQEHDLRQAFLDHLNTQADRTLPGGLYPTKYTEMNAVSMAREYVAEALLVRRFEPVLEQLYEQSDITVWICANDSIAHLAKSFLDRKGASSKNRPSMISFDDSPLAQQAQISSYNFNLPAVAAEIVDGLIHARPLEEQGVVLRVPGFVNDRGSVAKRSG